MSQKSEITASSLKQRVSTEDIDNTVNYLQLAFGDGRLDEQDFDERMTLAFKAKTRDQLMAVVEDLVICSPEISPFLSPSTLPNLSPKCLVICSGNEVRGPFVMPERYRIIAIMGGCVLDLREAQFAGPVTDIHIVTVMGGVQIIVPSGVIVQLNGLPILGGFSQNLTSNPASINAPVLRIHGVAVMGGVDVSDQEHHYHNSGRYKLGR